MIFQGTLEDNNHPANGLGEDDTQIGTVDSDGVALAAIQALNAQLQNVRSEVADRRDRLARLEAAVASSVRR